MKAVAQSGKDPPRGRARGRLTAAGSYMSFEGRHQNRIGMQQYAQRYGMHTVYSTYNVHGSAFIGFVDFLRAGEITCQESS